MTMTMPPMLASGPGSFRLVIDLWMSFLRNHCFLLSLFNPPSSSPIPAHLCQITIRTIIIIVNNSIAIPSSYSSFSPNRHPPTLATTRHLLISAQVITTNTHYRHHQPPPRHPSSPNNKRKIAALTCSFGCLSVKQCFTFVAVLLQKIKTCSSSLTITSGWQAVWLVNLFPVDPIARNCLFLQNNCIFLGKQSHVIALLLANGIYTTAKLLL